MVNGVHTLDKVFKTGKLIKPTIKYRENTVIYKKISLKKDMDSFTLHLALYMKVGGIIMSILDWVNAKMTMEACILVPFKNIWLMDLE